MMMTLLFVAPAHAQDSRTYDRPLEMRGYQHDGAARFYGVYQPATYQRGRPAPLIVALHGRFSSPQALHAISGLAAVAEARGAIVIYPETLEGVWNDGGHELLNRHGPAADDAGFIRSVIEAATQDFTIDRSQIFVAGYDSGASMAYTLACQGQLQLAGVVALSALMWDYQANACPTARATSMLIIHGRRDEALPVNGGATPNVAANRLSASETLAHWRRVDGCQSNATANGRDDSTLFTSCADGTSVAYVGVGGGNHDWFHTGDGYALNRQGVSATALLDSFFFDRAHFALPDGRSSGGRSRSWVVYAPPNYDPTRPTPVVVLLHGRSSTGAGQALLSGMNDVADEHNFLVVYPDGLDNQWNAQFDLASRTFSLSGQSSTLPQDDVGFLKTLMDDVSVDFNVDRSRLYLGGFSNGGFMTHRMACSASDTFAAFAAVGAALYIELQRYCQRSPPSPILIMHGSADPSVPIDGVEVSNPQGGEPIRITLTVQETVAGFARRNHCSMRGASTTYAESGRSPGTHVVKFVPYECDPGDDVVYYLINGGGHTWPGRAGIMPEDAFGATNMDFNASEAIWDFFEAHTLQPRARN